MSAAPRASRIFCFLISSHLISSLSLSLNHVNNFVSLPYLSECAVVLLDEESSGGGGADPDQPDAGGECGQRETPTMVAARLNDAATLKALFARGADLTAVDENGTDALTKVREGRGEGNDSYSTLHNS